ncbi:MAG: hypothetical protein PHS19_01765 [Eubacteriales bacterium]|nr:hypothetical protein [Eubacteriales bacterium]
MKTKKAFTTNISNITDCAKAAANRVTETAASRCPFASKDREEACEIIEEVYSVSPSTMKQLKKLDRKSRRLERKLRRIEKKKIKLLRN